MKNSIVLPIAIGTSLIFLSLAATSAFSANTDNTVREIIEENNKQNQPQNKEPLPNTRGGKPPQQAIDICLSQSENSVCSFQGPNTLEQGACEFTPDKQYFACNPSRDKITSKQVKQLPSHLATHQD